MVYKLILIFVLLVLDTYFLIELIQIIKEMRENDTRWTYQSNQSGLSKRV